MGCPVRKLWAQMALGGEDAGTQRACLVHSVVLFQAKQLPEIARENCGTFFPSVFRERVPLPPYAHTLPVLRKAGQ